MKLHLEKPLKHWSINQSFGANFNNFYKELGLLGHNGIDFFALDSTEVYATHDGRITFTGYDGAGGLGVVIRTEEKFDYYNTKTGALEPAYFKTIYWHLKKGTIKVTGGQTVKTGDLIALADNTGRSTGAHLHFGLKPIMRGELDWIWYNAEPSNGYNGAIDPLFYFDLPKYKFTQNMKFGSRGDEVKELQKALYYVGPVDGIFGKITKGAVTRFQLSHNLVGDGIVGVKTRAVLNNL